MGLIYATVFAGLPWLLRGSSEELFWLSIWGSGYFALAVTMARSTSAEVLQIIRSRVLPLLSPEAAAAIDDDLKDRFNSIRIQIVSFGSAVVAALISAIAIRMDVFPRSSIMSGASAQITYCCIGFFVLFLTAARTTDVARFYGTFAAHLHFDRERIYPLDPARSVLVTSVASLGRRILLFWFGIACSVVTLLVLFWWRQHLFLFVLIVVPIASFFSLVVGTIVFLGNEQKIRYVVNGVAAATQRSLERDISALAKDRNELDDAKWTRLKELIELRNSMASAGWYQSIRLSILSVVAPLLGPAVALLSIWKHTP
jgi:hypothetical protein